MMKGKNLLKRQRCLTEGGVCPHSVSQWWAIIMAGTPSIRTFAMTITTRHCGQQGMG
jgi:hypothetical protein